MRTERLTPKLVIEAAALMADADGLSRVTVTSVARVLGVQQPALYRHIEGYDGLIRELSLRGRELLATALADAALGRAGDDAVTAMAHAWRRFAGEHPGLYEATDRAPSTGDPDMEAAIEHVTEVLQRALVGYDLDADDAVHAARTMRSAFHGFCHLELSREHPSPVDLDDSYVHLIELVCAGIRALSTATVT